MTAPAGLVALTGATGFVGAHVLDRLLAAGCRVNALTRRPQPARPGVAWIAGDLDDPAALARLTDGADAVVHVAGLIKARRTREFFAVNEGGTRRVLDAIGERNIRYIHLSSISAREPQLSAYAASKAAAETAVLERSGLDFTILRPPVVYGPGDRETLVFFRAARSRRALLPGSPRHRTSLIHVHDLAAAVVAAMAAPALSGRTADVHDGAPDGYAFPEVLSMIAGRAAWHRPLFVPPAALGSVGALTWMASLFTGGAPMLTPGKARELSFPDWVCHDRSLFEEAGWTPALPASIGLPATRAWYEENGYLR
ncbi:MAG: NAD-dependent epimerase/dehydratase family protein [Alphaproteobacteria bacterium]|nr:NAD-dependent epimerase/dehydratase family protein [Alphaproteobacteria bacterium]